MLQTCEARVEDNRSRQQGRKKPYRVDREGGWRPRMRTLPRNTIVRVFASPMIPKKIN